ncbi:MAG: hypothetical protein ACOCWG_03750 [bacterium]
MMDFTCGIIRKSYPFDSLNQDFTISKQGNIISFLYFSFSHLSSPDRFTYCSNNLKKDFLHDKPVKYYKSS